MTTYDAVAICRNLRCTVVEYAYDQSGEAPECPACEQRDRADTLAARLAAVETLAEFAQYVSIHVGGGNLVERKRMVHLDDLRAALATGATINQQEGEQ